MIFCDKPNCLEPENHLIQEAHSTTSSSNLVNIYEMATTNDLGPQYSNADPAVVQADIHFLKPDARHQEEKPYAFRYELDIEEVPQSNMEMEKVEGIWITDIRGRESEYSLNTNGFTVLKHQSALDYGDYYDPNRVSIYLRELEDLLKVRLNASKVEVFRHGVRRCLRKEMYCF